MSAYTFRNRTDAGQALARELGAYGNRQDAIVLALPRGGVPVAFEIAHALHAPMDIFLVRKLGVPGYEELAMGAISTGGTIVLNYSVVRQLRIRDDQIQQATAREQQELQRREDAFRRGRPVWAVEGRICILVDDGLATGSTMRAAVLALRKQNPARIVIAVPVASADICEEFKEIVDEIVCLYTPEPFEAVGRWYDDFAQLTDEEVRDYLAQAEREVAH